MSTFASEPNDTLATAYDTGLAGLGGFSASGYIGDEDSPEGVLNDITDVDLFKVDLQASNRLIVESAPLYESATPLSFADVRLFDSSGNYVAGGYGDGRLEYTIPSDGSYYVGVSSVNSWGWYDPNAEGVGGEWSGNLGDYTLTIAASANQSPVASDDARGALPSTDPQIISAWDLLVNDSDPEFEFIRISQVFSDDPAIEVGLNDFGDVVLTASEELSNRSATFRYAITDDWGNISEPATVTLDFGSLIVGTNKRDRLFGTNLPDRIEGKGGNDAIAGLDGDDLLFGGSGRDTLNGGYGSDRLVGGADADMLVVRPYEDTIVLETYGDSLLRSRDTIQAVGWGTLSIDAPWEDQSAWIDRSEAIAARSLREKSIANTLEILSDSFMSLGAAFFTYRDRTFLAIDDGAIVDGRRTFSAESDSILEISGNFYDANVF